MDRYVLKDKETGKYIGRYQKGFVDSLHDAQVFKASDSIDGRQSEHLEILGVESTIVVNGFDLVALSLDGDSELVEQNHSSPIKSLTFWHPNEKVQNKSAVDQNKNLPIQPVEYTVKNNLSYLQGNVVDLITRYKEKNGLQDLQKAKHNIDLIIQFEYLDECKTTK